MFREETNHGAHKNNTQVLILDTIYLILKKCYIVRED